MKIELVPAPSGKMYDAKLNGVLLERYDTKRAAQYAIDTIWQKALGRLKA